MTDYLKLAEECGGLILLSGDVAMNADDLARLIARVRAEERERCARKLESLHRDATRYFSAMGSAGCPEYDAKDCAEIIRALPEEPQ